MEKEGEEIQISFDRETKKAELTRLESIEQTGTFFFLPLYVKQLIISFLRLYWKIYCKYLIDHLLKIIQKIEII